MHASRFPFAALVAVAVACGDPSNAPSSVDGGARADGGPNGVIEPPPDAGLDAQGDADAPADGGAASDDGPFPLGATWGARALHFRLRADAATRGELDVYAAP